MSEDTFHIPIRKGHHKKLRFWFAPISQAIMDADADWLENEELSCDNICTRELFYPFIEKFFPGEFKWRNEINIMPFDRIHGMIEEVRKVVKTLTKDYYDPTLLPYKQGFAIDLLVSPEEYDEKYVDAPDSITRTAIEDHKSVIIDFYTGIADYLDEICDRYEPEGFLGVAICAPH